MSESKPVSIAFDQTGGVDLSIEIHNGAARYMAKPFGEDAIEIGRDAFFGAVAMRNNDHLFGIEQHLAALVRK